MSISIAEGESYPDRHFTIPQLLYAAKMKLCDSTFGGRVTTTMNQVEVNHLEQKTLEVLSLVRSVKNNFAPINRIPRAILSLIPRYWGHHHTDTDEDLITLTHVCRGWRKLFASHPSLWTRLDFTSVDKTRAYIERSRSLPLEIVICKSEDKPYIEDAFLLAVPHVKRFKSLTIGRTSDSLRNLTKHLTLPVPFLKELKIRFTCDPAPVLDSMLFNKDLSSLRTLSLGGVITHLPWRNLWNLTTFDLLCPPDNRIAVINLLNFLESAPHLKDITLRHSIPPTSNACSSRVVCLPHLKNLTIFGDPVHATLLNHLSIPEGASLVLDFNFSGDESPLPNCLPRTVKNLKNLFRVTTVNLCFAKREKFVHLVGPSGRLDIFGHWEREVGTSVFPSLDLFGCVDRRILQSLNYFSLHMTRRLAVTKYEPPPRVDNKCHPRCILLLMKDLRTLVLTQCFNLPFIFALDPDHPGHHPLKGVLCPNLEELVLYIEAWDAFNIPELVSMAKHRASKGAKLRSITIVGLGELVPGKEVFKLREHVTHLEYRFEENPPKWDSIPKDESG